MCIRDSATLRADNEELQQQYEAGLERAKGRLGQVHRNLVDGAERDGDGTFEVRSPIENVRTIDGWAAAIASTSATISAWVWNPL